MKGTFDQICVAYLGCVAQAIAQAVSLCFKTQKITQRFLTVLRVVFVLSAIFMPCATYAAIANCASSFTYSTHTDVWKNPPNYAEFYYGYFPDGVETCNSCNSGYSGTKVSTVTEHTWFCDNAGVEHAITDYCWYYSPTTTTTLDIYHCALSCSSYCCSMCIDGLTGKCCGGEWYSGSSRCCSNSDCGGTVCTTCSGNTCGTAPAGTTCSGGCCDSGACVSGSTTGGGNTGCSAGTDSIGTYQCDCKCN